VTGPAAGLLTGAEPGPARDGWGALGIRVYYRETRALDDVSLLLPSGQVTVVVGGDGAGKTTLLRCVAGALAPQAGQVRTPGPRGIGYLPAGSGTYPDLTVAENLAFRATAYGLAPSQARERSAELIAAAGLTGATDRLAGQLSGGMRQKLGVIAALLPGPDLLILDEPTTGIDPVSRASLWRLIAGAAADGAAVVLATTYLDEAERAASVLVLADGRPLGTGTPAQIVAAMPGSIVAPAGPPGDADQARSWRRAGQWRTWVPPGVAPPAGDPVIPDLQDAVTVAALAREPDAPPGPAARLAGPATRLSRPAAAAGTTLAECVAVTRRFGSFTAVREVSLRVGPGEIVGLLGANGAGKTTLIRMLLGLLPASSGTVALFGAPPSRLTRQRLGYVPQGLGLYDDLTVAENLEFSAAVFGGGADDIPPAETTLGGSLPVGRLPLGLQRRAAFAQALAHRPDLLILDEPTSGVDPLGRARLWDTVRSAAEAGAGVLVTTHYLEEAHECDRLVIMADGAVVARGTPAQVIGDATVTVVQSSDWRAAFGRLTGQGLDVSLAGTALRVPDADPDAVRRALGDARAVVSQAPATLEERFFQLVEHSQAVAS
jgi:ABC-2 type transport system ATP-binding protein